MNRPINDLKVFSRKWISFQLYEYHRAIQSLAPLNGIDVGASNKIWDNVIWSLNKYSVTSRLVDFKWFLTDYSPGLI